MRALLLMIRFELMSHRTDLNYRVYIIELEKEYPGIEMISLKFEYECVLWAKENQRPPCPLGCLCVLSCN